MIVNQHLINMNTKENVIMNVQKILIFIFIIVMKKKKYVIQIVKFVIL